MPFQPFWTNRALKVRVRSYLGNFGPFWAILGAPGPKYGTPPAKTHPQGHQEFTPETIEFPLSKAKPNRL